MKVKVVVQLQNNKEAKEKAIEIYTQRFKYPYADIEVTEINTVLNTMTFSFTW